MHRRIDVRGAWSVGNEVERSVVSKHGVGVRWRMGCDASRLFYHGAMEITFLLSNRAKKFYKGTAGKRSVALSIVLPEQMI